MQGAVPVTRTGEQESRTVEESEGHSSIFGLFGAGGRCTCAAKERDHGQVPRANANLLEQLVLHPWESLTAHRLVHLPGKTTAQ